MLSRSCFQFCLLGGQHCRRGMAQQQQVARTVLAVVKDDMLRQLLLACRP